MDEAYLTQLLGANIAQATVTTLINTGLTGYCPASYVSTQAALNATKAQVDAGDAARLHLAQVGVVNGVAGLNAVTGRIDSSHLSLTSTQRFPSPLYSPSSYWGSNQTATAVSEVQIDTLTVTNPGYTYKALITGLVDGQTDTDGQYPIIRVRAGSTTGPVVAVGAGLAEEYVAGLRTSFTTPGTTTYTIPSWLAGLDRIALGAGGGGGASFFVTGEGGLGGHFAVDTLVLGTGLPFSTPTLSITVGAGGIGGTTTGGSPGTGQASTVTGIGVASLTGVGGVGGGQSFSAVGGSASAVSWDGNIYQGGPSQSIAGGTGNAPGGGGASGAAGVSAPGGAGANGAVWLFAYPTPNAPGGPIVIMPTPLNAQTALTGATTFYVMLVASGTATVSATTLKPLLQATPFPA